MNVFFLDRDPVKAAQAHCDKHVVKMVLETAQLLSTAVRTCSPFGLLKETDEVLYKPTHVNHPCAVWVRSSTGSFVWTTNLFRALSAEYTFRYGKIHKSSALSRFFDPVPAGIPWVPEWVEPPLCMPDEYKDGIDGDPVKSYRNYYRDGKKSLHSWKIRGAPDWL